MRIGITNVVLSNSGDAAIVQGIIDALSATDAYIDDIVVFDSNAKATRALYPQWQIEQQLTTRSPGSKDLKRRLERKIRKILCTGILRFPRFSHLALGGKLLNRTGVVRTYRSLRACDLMISTGGTYLVDSYGFGFRATEIAIAASQSGSPVVMWTQSLGPFRAGYTLDAIRSISSNASRFYLRDGKSLEYLTRAVPGELDARVVPDAAFSIRWSSDCAGTSRAMSGESGLSVIVSVREWHAGVNTDDASYENYVESMREVAVSILASGGCVTALSTCQGVASYHHDDSATAASIFGSSGVEIVTDHHTPEGLLREISRHTLVFTTRMHLAILALIAGVPVIAVAYEFKTVELFNSLGLSDWVIPIESLQADWVLERVERIKLGNGPVLAAEHLEQLRRDSAQPAREVIASASVSI